MYAMQVIPASCNMDTPAGSLDPSSYMRKQCADGYHGPLCAMCIRGGPQPYGRTGTWACQRCRSTSAILAMFIASNLVTLAWLYYTIHTTLKDNEEDVAGIATNKVKPSELTRVSLNVCCGAPYCAELYCAAMLNTLLCCAVLCCLWLTMLW